MTASASDKGRDFYYGAGARFNLKEFMYVGLEYARLDMALDKSGVDAEHSVDNVALTLGVFF